MRSEGERCEVGHEMGGRAYKAKQLPQCSWALAAIAHINRIPTPRIRSVSAVSGPCPSSEVTTARATACPIRSRRLRHREAAATATTRPPPPRIRQQQFPVPASGRSVPTCIPEWNRPRDRAPDHSRYQRSEPSETCVEGSGLLAGHGKQGQRRRFEASQACCGLLSGEPDSADGLEDACRRRIAAAGAAIAVCAARKVERDSAGAGAARVDSQKDLFQFGLIGCVEEM